MPNPGSGRQYWKRKTWRVWPVPMWNWTARWRVCLTGDGYGAATLSVLVKTGLLYTIMVTGALWEKAVFGQYLFAPAFFWEDVISFAVISLHTFYLYGLIAGTLSPQAQMVVALAAYVTYVVNATQFILKLRRARLDRSVMGVPA